MDAKPDHGEESYRGSGRLTGNKTDKRKGRTTKLRGHLRSGKGRAKRAAS